MFPAYVRPGFSHLPSQDLDSFLTHMFWSVPRWRCERDVLKIPNLLSLLYATLSSLILYLAKYPPWPPQALNTVSTQRMLDSEFSLPELWQENLFMKLKQLQGLLHVFPFSQRPLSCSACLPTSEKYCFKYFVQTFRCFMLKDKLWLEVKVNEEILEIM